MEDGHDLLGLEEERGEHRAERPEARPGDPSGGGGDRPQHRGGVVGGGQDGHEEHGGHRGGRFEHRHLEDHPGQPLGGGQGDHQGHVGPERHPPDHGALDPEVVEQADDLPGVGVHPVGGGATGLARGAVAGQVEEDHPVAGVGQVLGQPAVRGGVEQEAVQVDQHVVAAAETS